MGYTIARTLSGLAISLLALTATINPLPADPINVGLTFSQGTCNVVIVEGNPCTVTFTLTNVDPTTNMNNTIAMYLNLVSITSSAGGDLANPPGTAEDPASIQAGGFSNPCKFVSGGGNPAVPGGMCSETVTITTDNGGDGEPTTEKPDFGTTVFTAVWQGLTPANIPSADSAKAQFTVVIADPNLPPPPPNNPPAPTVSYLPEPATFSTAAVAFLWMAARMRRRRGNRLNRA